MSCECDTTVVKVQKKRKKKKFFPLSVSVFVGFSLAAVLHVEGQNVYYPKISNMAASGRGGVGGGLTHPVRVLVLSAPSPEYVHSAARKQERGSSPPLLVGCMLCFIRVESHDNLGMNI